MTISENTQNDIFRNAVEALKDPLPQRVWSVIVSLFGDLAQGEGDQISGVALTEVAGLIGIRAEAIRVALHRLRKEGWIDSIREGRSSQHQLTQKGRQDTVSATPRIYARNAQSNGTWRIACAEDDAGLNKIKQPQTGYIALSRRVALIADYGIALPPDLLVFQANSDVVPRWMQDRICPPDLTEAAATLEHALLKSNALIRDAANFDPVQRAAMRTLIVHRWRRVVLRIPDLPNMFFPPDWPGETCRRLTFDLLDQLPTPTLSELETSVAQRR